MTDKVKIPFRSSHGAQKEIPGVVYQAHLVSQLIDIATGDRLPLRPLSPIADCTWILLWAGVGSLVAVKLSRPIDILVGSGIVVVVLPGICWLAFVGLGLWIPLVPAAASLTGTVIACKFIPKSFSDAKLKKLTGQQPART